jgi:pimeloyl-ACP methyl ester carboxylesterase
MKTRRALRPIAGMLLCVIGFAVAWPPGTAFRKTTVIVDAGGCSLVTDVIDHGEDDAQGFVVLLHGLAANKKIMSYLAQGFALQDLRVFVPDLPGHGRTPGPFSFLRSAACSDAFTHQLIARGAIDPARTIVAGHSMGGAIAVIVGSHVPIAGVIAISPAPMTAARGIPTFMLPFDTPLSTPANTLAISGAWEPGEIRETAQDLGNTAPGGTGKHISVTKSTHVSVLGDPRVMRASQDWAQRVLQLPQSAPLPSSRPFIGWFTGFVGLLLLAGPFIRETIGPILLPKLDLQQNATATVSHVQTASEQGAGVPIFRAMLEVVLASLLAVGILALWNPPRYAIGLFQGDYFAAFLLLLGIALLALHRKKIAPALRVKPATVVKVAAAALILHLLIMTWFELTITETWLTPARWLRFPALLAAVLPYHLAEEVLLGPLSARPPARRLTWALLLRLIAWGALIAAIFVLHSGQIFLVLLAAYFGLFCLLQRLGMSVVRKDTGSPLAAALFGAILLASFSLVVFPIT